MADQERRTRQCSIPAREHPNIRPCEACIKSTKPVIALAKKHAIRLHVLHISTIDEVALFEPAPVKGKQITAETCVLFLQFDDSGYEKLGFLIKCNPAIKTDTDREGIIKGLAEGRIDLLSTDHAPHLLSEKKRAVRQGTVRLAAGAICLAPGAAKGARRLCRDLVLVDPNKPQQ